MRLLFAPLALLLVAGCHDSDTVGPDDSHGDVGPVVNQDAEDVRLILAEVIDAAGLVHVGDRDTAAELPDPPAEVAGHVAAADCEPLGAVFPFSEWDCSEAMVDRIVDAHPALAGAPLIYPGIHTGGFTDGEPSMGDWESHARPIRIVVAVKKAAFDADSFAGIGFQRIGSEFRSRFLREQYPEGGRGRELFDQTTDPVATLDVELKVLGEASRVLPGGDTEPVVVLEFLYFAHDSIKRPSILGGFAWQPGSAVSFKPYAAFRDGGTEFRNWDPRGKDYRAELGETGVIHDFRAELRGIDL